MTTPEHRHMEALALMARCGLVGSADVARGWDDAAMAVLLRYRQREWIGGPCDDVCELDLELLRREAARQEMARGTGAK